MLQNKQRAHSIRDRALLGLPPQLHEQIAKYLSFTNRAAYRVASKNMCAGIQNNRNVSKLTPNGPPLIKSTIKAIISWLRQKIVKPYNEFDILENNEGDEAESPLEYTSRFVHTVVRPAFVAQAKNDTVFAGMKLHVPTGMNNMNNALLFNNVNVHHNKRFYSYNRSAFMASRVGLLMFAIEFRVPPFKVIVGIMKNTYQLAIGGIYIIGKHVEVYFEHHVITRNVHPMNLTKVNANFKRLFTTGASWRARPITEPRAYHSQMDDMPLVRELLLLRQQFPDIFPLGHKPHVFDTQMLEAHRNALAIFNTTTQAGHAFLMKNANTSAVASYLKYRKQMRKIHEEYIANMTLRSGTVSNFDPSTLRYLKKLQLVK